MNNPLSPAHRINLRMYEAAGPMSLSEVISLYESTCDSLDAIHPDDPEREILLHRRSDLFDHAYLLFLRDRPTDVRVAYMARMKDGFETQLPYMRLPGDHRLEYFLDLAEIVSAAVIECPSQRNPQWRCIYYDAPPERLAELKEYLEADGMTIEPYPLDLIAVLGRQLN